MKLRHKWTLLEHHRMSLSKLAEVYGNMLTKPSLHLWPEDGLMLPFKTTEL